MFCSKCGSKIKEGNAFCFVCGNQTTGAGSVEKETIIIEKLLEKILEIKRITVSNSTLLTEAVGEFKELRSAYTVDKAFNELHLKITEMIACLQIITESAEHLIRFLEENKASKNDIKESGDALTVVNSIDRELQKCNGLTEYIERVLYVCEIANSTEAFLERISVGLREMKRDLFKTSSDFKRAKDSFSSLYSVASYMPFASAAATPPPPEMCMTDSALRTAGAIGTKGAEKRSFLSLFKRHKGPKPESLTLPDDLIPPIIPDNICGSEKDTLRIDGVSFSGIVKKTVEKEEYIPVDIIMYEQEFRNVVDAMLDDLHNEKGGGFFEVNRLAKIKVLLSSPDIEIDGCMEERTWHGNYLEFSFAVPVPETYTKKQILIIAEVFINDITATILRMIVNVDNGAHQNIVPEREDITSAFISYASKDRKRVAAIVQGIQKARPDMDVFFDVESLRSGQMWEDALKAEIDGRNIFYLCWSEAASKSRWVEFEWRYALERKGEKMIEPIPIDPPELCPPPPELSRKHFNDKLLYLMKALENA